MQYCYYGCKQEANHVLANGKWCCSPHISQCTKTNWEKVGNKYAICPHCDKYVFKAAFKRHVEKCKEVKRCVICDCDLPYDKRNNQTCGHEPCIRELQCRIQHANYLALREKVKKVWDAGETAHGVAHIMTLKKIYIDLYNIRACEKCGKEDWWNDAPLTLQLDHINTTNTDDRRENLRILCPDCHTQTKGYSGRGGWVERNKFTEDEAIQIYLDSPTMSVALSRLGLSSNGSGYLTLKHILLDNKIPLKERDQIRLRKQLDRVLIG